jgi:hypothetical protein
MVCFIGWTLLARKILIVSGILIGAGFLVGSSTAQAQITVPRILTAEGDRYANLQEQLTNRLRATREDQQAYIRFVVEKVRKEELDQRLVVAIERYAMRRHREYPFPFFERALRYEAAKRGVALPPVKHFASTKAVPVQIR